MPAFSFLGVLAYIFVSLYYNPSKGDIKEDESRARTFLARFFAAIGIGIAVYVVLHPFSNADADTVEYTKYAFASFGFASGFYISSVLGLLRRKIMNLIDGAGFEEDENERIARKKEEERNGIMTEMKVHPEVYMSLSNDGIKTTCDKTKIDVEEFKKRIDFIKFVGTKAFKKLAEKGIIGFEDMILLSDEGACTIKCIDEGEYIKIINYVKILGAGKVRNLFNKGITHKEFPNLRMKRSMSYAKNLKLMRANLKRRRQNLRRNVKRVKIPM